MIPPNLDGQLLNQVSYGLDKCIFVPNAKDLRLHILQQYHDHILVGHFGQNWTLENI